MRKAKARPLAALFTKVRVSLGMRRGEGKLFCCIVLDTFSRRVMGWSIDSGQETSLVTSALGMAIGNRDPNPDQTVIHSDHGSHGACPVEHCSGKT